jgi:hypothetical protein
MLAIQEAKIRRIKVRSQPGQILSQDPILKIPNTKRAGGVVQGVGPEFKSKYHICIHIHTHTQDFEWQPAWWLMPVIIAICEAEIRQIKV